MVNFLRQLHGARACQVKERHGNQKRKVVIDQKNEINQVETEVVDSFVLLKSRLGQEKGSNSTDVAQD